MSEGTSALALQHLIFSVILSSWTHIYFYICVLRDIRTPIYFHMCVPLYLCANHLDSYVATSEISCGLLEKLKHELNYTQLLRACFRSRLLSAFLCVGEYWFGFHCFRSLPLICFRQGFARQSRFGGFPAECVRQWRRCALLCATAG